MTFAQVQGSTKSNRINSSQSIDSLKFELSSLNRSLDRAEGERMVLRIQLDTAFNALERTYNAAKQLKDSVELMEKKSLPKKEQERIQSEFDEVLTRLEKLTDEGNKSEELLSKKNAEIKELKEKISKIKKQLKDLEAKNSKSN